MTLKSLSTKACSRVAGVFCQDRAVLAGHGKKPPAISQAVPGSCGLPAPRQRAEPPAQGDAGGMILTLASRNGGGEEEDEEERGQRPAVPCLAGLGAGGGALLLLAPLSHGRGAPALPAALLAMSPLPATTL